MLIYILIVLCLSLAGVAGLQPDLLRRLCWTPPEPLDEAGIATRLVVGGARPWQVALMAPALATALAEIG